MQLAAQQAQAEKAQQAQAQQAQLAAAQAQLAAQASAAQAAAQASAAQAAAPGGGDMFSGLAVQSAGANTAAADALFATPPSAMMATAAPAGWPCPACTLDNAAAVAVCEACGGARPQEGDILTNPSGMFGGMALAGGSHGGGIPAAAEAALGYTSPPALSEAKGPSSGGEAMSNMFAGLTTNPPPPTAAAASGGFGGGAGGKKEKPSCCSLVGGLASTMAGRKKGAKPRPPSPVGGGDETSLSPAEEALCATASLAPLRDPLSATAPLALLRDPLSATAGPP